MMKLMERSRLGTGNNKESLQNHFSILWLPRADSDAAKALARLLQGKRISHLDFFEDTNTYRLAARIYSLRNKRWPINSLWYSFGRKQYKKYFLSDEEINRLYRLDGERLKAFIARVKELEGRQ